MSDNILAKESRLSSSLSKALTGHYVRIENTIGRGTPDVSYTTPNGTHLWLELKVDTKGDVLIRPEQKVFMERQRRCKGQCLVICKHVSSGNICGWLYPFETATHKSGKLMIIEDPDIIVTKPSELNHTLNSL